MTKIDAFTATFFGNEKETMDRHATNSYAVELLRDLCPMTQYEFRNFARRNQLSAEELKYLDKHFVVCKDSMIRPK